MPRYREPVSSIDENVTTFFGVPGFVRDPVERDASFDYCYNHFQAYREEGRADQLAAGEAMQLSCLHLGFYLASWGMMRGSSVLLQKSAKYLEPVIKAIATSPPESWTTDADDYSDEAIDGLIATKASISDAFGHPASDTLVTKVMLGVFGSVPAFDTYFGQGSGMWTFGRRSLRGLRDFYNDHAEEIKEQRVATLDFATGEPTDRRYPCAKIIDMVYFVEGDRR